MYMHKVLDIRKALIDCDISSRVVKVIVVHEKWYVYLFIEIKWLLFRYMDE